MKCALRRVKYACGVWNRCGGEGFISFHLMRSIKFHNLQSKLFHRERQRAISLLFRLSVLNQKRGACRGEPPCRRWRRKARLWGEETRSSASALSSSQLHIIRFRLWRKLVHCAPRPLPKRQSFLGPRVLCDYVSEGQLQVLLPLPRKRPSHMTWSFSVKFVHSERVKYLRCEIFASQMWNTPAACEERILFHIATKEQYFTFAVRQTFHIPRQRDISQELCL